MGLAGNYIFNWCPNEVIEAFAEALKGLKIKSLDLSFSSISCFSASGKIKSSLDILAGILKGSEITHLNLAGCNIDGEKIKILSPVIQDSEITDLNLADNRLGNTALQFLSAWLKDSKIKNLILSDNEITPNGIKALAPALKGSQVRALDLSLNGSSYNRNGIGSDIDGLVLLLDSEITSLNLHKCHLDTYKLGTFMEKLKSSKITELTLDAHAFSSNIKPFASALKDSPVRSLNIDEHPGSALLKALITELKDSKTEISIHVVPPSSTLINPITEKDKEAIAELLKDTKIRISYAE